MNDDIEAINVGDIGNYEGGMIIRRTRGVCEWCIEGSHGRHWEPCPNDIFDALVANYIPKGTKQ